MGFGSLHWEIQAGGFDVNGSGFDPTGTGFMTDLAATVATSSAPVCTSVTYSFAAGDVGHWLYIVSGGTFIPGWYKIASVNAGAATLTAAGGDGILAGARITTAVGCATTASPTGGTFSIDYTQKTTTVVAVTDLATPGTGSVVVTSVSNPFTPAQVGNLMQIASGTGFTTGWYIIVAYTSASQVSLDRTPKASGGAGSAGVAKVGGAMKSSALVSLATAAGDTMHMASGAYTMSSGTDSVANGATVIRAGTVNNWTSLIGYGTLRYDLGTKPVITCSAVTNVGCIQGGDYTYVENIEIDGGNQTGHGFSGGVTNHRIMFRCKCGNYGAGLNSTAKAFTNSGSTGLAQYIECESYDINSTNTSGTSACFMLSQNMALIGCTARDCIGGTPAIYVAGGNKDMAMVNCLVHSNSAIGVLNDVGTQLLMVNVTMANNGSHGFSNASGGAAALINCIAADNVGTGFNSAVSGESVHLINCGVYGNGTDVSTNIPVTHQVLLVTATADPFVNQATDDYTLNNSSNGGKTFQSSGAPIGFGAAATIGRPSIGAAPKGGGGTGAGNPPVAGSSVWVGG